MPGSIEIWPAGIASRRSGTDAQVTQDLSFGRPRSRAPTATHFDTLNKVLSGLSTLFLWGGSTACYSPNRDNTLSEETSFDIASSSLGRRHTTLVLALPIGGVADSPRRAY